MDDLRDMSTDDLRELKQRITKELLKRRTTQIPTRTWKVHYWAGGIDFGPFQYSWYTSSRVHAQKHLKRLEAGEAGELAYVKGSGVIQHCVDGKWIDVQGVE